MQTLNTFVLCIEHYVSTPLEIIRIFARLRDKQTVGSALYL